jgi:hypothetical protein
MKKITMLALCALAVAACFLVACSTRSSVSETCLYKQQSPKPDWAEADPGIDGFYTGVGCALKGDDQLEHARKNALAALCETIKVSVKSEVDIKVTDHSTNGVSTSTSRKMEHSVQSLSDLNLSDITEAGRWLDQDNCMIWVRLKMKRDLVNQFITLKQADDLYKRAADRQNGLSPSDRLKLIADAYLVLKTVDFTRLPVHYGTRDLLTKRFTEARDSITTQSAHGKILFTVAGGATLCPDDKKALAERFMRGMGGKAVYQDTALCNDEQTCMDYGRGNNAAFLVRIDADTDLSTGSMGMWKGTLYLTVTVSDLAHGKRVSERIAGSGSILSFDKNRFNWQEVLEKLFEEKKFDQVENLLRSL